MPSVININASSSSHKQAATTTEIAHRVDKLQQWLWNEEYVDHLASNDAARLSYQFSMAC